MPMTTCVLPCYGIVVKCDPIKGAGTIQSELMGEGNALQAAFDAIESLILAHACAGIDIQNPGYIEGIETAVETVSKHYD